MNTRTETQYVEYIDGRGVASQLPLSLKVLHCSWCLVVCTKGEMIRAMPRLKRLNAIGCLGEIGGKHNGRPVCTGCKAELKKSEPRRAS